MRKVSRINTVLSILLLAFLFVGLQDVGASDATKQRVFDDANILQEDDLSKIEATAEEHSIEQKTDFIILTTDEGFTQAELKRYVQDMYDEQGYGFDKKHGNTALLALDVNSREVYLAGFYKAEKYLNNTRVELVLDEMMGALRSDNFYRAFTTFIVTSSEYMQFSPWVNPESILLKSSFQFIAALILAGAIVGMMAYNSSGKVTTNLNTYLDTERTQVLKKRDRYIRTTVTKTRKPKNKSSSGGGGGGGTTRGGHSHSGGGRSF